MRTTYQLQNMPCGTKRKTKLLRMARDMMEGMDLQTREKNLVTTFMKLLTESKFYKMQSKNKI